MLRWSIIIVLQFSLFYGHLLCQNVDFVPRNFKGKETELRRINVLIEKGDSLFYKTSSGNSAEALKYYLEANLFNPDNTLLNYKTGACYLLSTQKQKAGGFLLRSYREDPGISTDICYLLGQSYHYHESWDSALYYYRLFEERYFSDHTSMMSREETELQREELHKRIKWTENAKGLTLNPINAQITNLGNEINSPDPDYNPKVSANSKVLAFTSRRSNTTGGGRHILDDKFYEDIYISMIQDKKWLSPINPGTPLNSEKNDGLVSLSLDGQSLILDYGGISGDLFESRLYGERWTKPKGFPSQINSIEIESSACYSPDGKILYFSSDRPGGYGGSDIWSAIRNADGSFQPAENLGPQVNSPYNEEYIFVHADGISLYFSSDGLNSMGGYDIFLTKFLNGQWEKPVNIGYPVNTADDDIYFSVSPDGKTAWYSSERQEGYGGQDIYKIEFSHNEMKPAPIRLVNGRIMDAVSFEPLSAEIEITDKENNEIILRKQSKSSDGSFSIALPAGKKYGIVYNATGYLFFTENIDLSRLDSFRGACKHIFLYLIDKTPHPEKPIQKAVSKYCFTIECDSNAIIWTDPADGSIDKDKRNVVQQDIADMILRNREKVQQFLEGGILMDDVVDLLCQEYLKTITGSSLNVLTERTTDIWQLIKDELMTFRKLQEINPADSIYFSGKYHWVSRKINHFNINLSLTTADAINDTTARLEISVNLETAILNNLIRVVLDNRQLIRNLNNKKWNNRSIREQLAYEIAVCGGFKQSIELSRQSVELQELVMEALVMVMPDIFKQSIFFRQNLPNSAEIQQFDILVSNRRSKIRDLIGTGKSEPEINELLWQEYQNFAFVAPNNEDRQKLKIALKKEMLGIVKKEYLGFEMGNTTVEPALIRELFKNGFTYNDYKECIRLNDSSLQDIKAITPVINKLIPDKRLFKLSLYETSREAISDEDGSITEDKKGILKMDIKRIIQDYSELILAMKNAGYKQNEITGLLANEIAQCGGAINDSGQAICHPSVITLIEELLNLTYNQDIDRHLFDLDLLPGEVKTISGFTVNNRENSDLGTIFDRLIASKQEIITVLLKTSYDWQKLQDEFLKEIIDQCPAAKQDNTELKSALNNSFERYLNNQLLIPTKYKSRIILNNIFFESNKAELTSSSNEELMRLIGILKKYPAIRVEISGHTDNIGSEIYNMDLSLRRARSVEAYLLKNGIAANRLVSIGYGKTRPVAPNQLDDGTDYSEGRQMNRRTEFVIID